MNTAQLTLDCIEDAIAAFGRGQLVIVVDHADREDEGDLVCAAESTNAEQLAFMIRHTSGIICVPMLGEDLDRLELPLMTRNNEELLRTAFTVSVDARAGITTGVAAAERAQTIRALAAPDATAEDFVRPGHTEATIDLALLAGLRPAGVLAELVNDDGTMMRGGQLRRFADDHGLVLISVEDLVRYRRERDE